MGQNRKPRVYIDGSKSIESAGAGYYSHRLQRNLFISGVECDRLSDRAYNTTVNYVSVCHFDIQIARGEA